MISRLLNLCGLYLGPAEDLLFASTGLFGVSIEDNPGDYWENIHFVRFNDEILRVFGGDLFHVPGFKPGWSHDERLLPLRHRVLGLTKDLVSHIPWGWKDPRNTVTLEFWQSVVPDLKIVLCVRNPLEVIASLLKRDKGISAAQVWLRYHEVLLETLASSPHIVTNYETYFYDPAAEIRRIATFIDLAPSEQAIQDAIATISPDLHRNISVEALLEKEKDVPISVQKHYAALCAEAGPVYERMSQDEAYQNKLLKTNLFLQHDRFAARLDQIQQESVQARDVLVTEYEARFTILKQENEKKLSSLAREHLEALETLASKHRAEQDALVAEHKMTLEQLELQFRAQQAVLVEEHKTDLEWLEFEHSAERAAISNELSEVRNQLETERHRIAAMQNTRGWHVLERWRRFKLRLLPANSRRLRLYYLVRTALTILLTQGPIQLLQRLAHWLKGERRYYRPRPTQAAHKDAESEFLFHPFRDQDYENYMRQVEPSSDELKRQKVEAGQWADPPKFHIVTPVYNPQLPVLQETVRSVLTQTYPHWQWHVVDASTDENVLAYLVSVAEREPRMVVVRQEENSGISENTNVALRQIEDGYVALLDHDDTISPEALFAVSCAIRNNPIADFLYSDTDKLDEQGYRCEPLFKPAWSPDMLLCANYLGQLTVFRASLLKEVGYLGSAMDGAQDWDLYFRIVEHTDNVTHIPKVLYHWRRSGGSTAQATDNKPGIREAQQIAISSHLRRAGLTGVDVRFDMSHPIHRVHPLSTWQQNVSRRISIVIPSKDSVHVLRKCLFSLYTHTTYPNYEVVLVDTGSVEAKTRELYDVYKTKPNFTVVPFNEPFNFGRARNLGAHHASGELLLFLNNNTEIIDGHWLSVMAQWFELPGIGIVGAKLLYPNRTLQHAGVIVGMGGLASHVFRGQPENIATVFGTDGWYRDLLSVTGACLMISKEVFHRVGGFDEGFVLNYSDVDLCLRVRELGYRVTYTPHARLIHREHVSHGALVPRRDFERATVKWQRWLRDSDPFFNANLSYQSETPDFKRDLKTDTPAILNRSLMARMPDKEFIKLPSDLL